MLILVVAPMTLAPAKVFMARTRTAKSSPLAALLAIRCGPLRLPQGPGPSQFTNGDVNQKPDIVAPTMFSERNDRHTRNGGTSAACAMAAGVVAALREGWGPEVVPPSEMKQLLRETAWRPGKTWLGWTSGIRHRQ